MTDSDGPYKIEVWCYQCDDFVVIADFGERIPNEEEFGAALREQSRDELPCGHSFHDGTQVSDESETRTLKKKIARRKQELDTATHPVTQELLRRTIQELLAELAVARVEERSGNGEGEQR